MELTTLAFGAAGVISGLVLERSASFPRALAGGAALGLAGCAITYGVGKSDVGHPLTAFGVGIALGTSVSSLSSRSAVASNALPPSPNSSPSPVPLPSAGVSWDPMQAIDGSYAVTAGVHYRAVASLNTGVSKTQVASYLTGHGWSNVIVYDTGDALPAGWPTEAPGALESGRRWIRVDAIRTGSSATQAAETSFPASLLVQLRISNVWTAP
jgi:hypothetical protein